MSMTARRSTRGDDRWVIEARKCRGRQVRLPGVRSSSCVRWARSALPERRSGSWPGGRSAATDDRAARPRWASPQRRTWTRSHRGRRGRCRPGRCAAVVLVEGGQPSVGRVQAIDSVEPKRAAGSDAARGGLRHVESQGRDRQRRVRDLPLRERHAVGRRRPVVWLDVKARAGRRRCRRSRRAARRTEPKAEIEASAHADARLAPRPCAPVGRRERLCRARSDLERPRRPSGTRARARSRQPLGATGGGAARSREAVEAWPGARRRSRSAGAKSAPRCPS